MYELGLASLLNAQTVNLGPVFYQADRKRSRIKNFL